MDNEQLRGYVFTLEIAARELPGHAHPVHRERLLQLRDHYGLQLDRLEHGQEVIGEFCAKMTGR